jgi:deazaflavin-dependent oxidoreductase (nitroreductase family)
MAGLHHLPSRSEPRRNIVAGQPVKWRVKALDVVLRPWFAYGPHRGMAVLGTMGRRSGKPRRHCVRAIRKGDRAYLVAIPGSHAAWLSNIRANPRVSLQVRGMKLEGTAREIGHGPERDEAKAAYVGTVNLADYVECFLHWHGRPARWKIQRLHEMWFEGGIPLVIVLDGRAGSDPAHPE